MENGDVLISPACGEECRPCYRRCAVARIHLNWWQREEARLLQAPVAEGVPGRAEWIANLAEAAERMLRLRRGMRPCAPNSLASAFRAGFREAPAQARLHSLPQAGRSLRRWKDPRPSPRQARQGPAETGSCFVLAEGRKPRLDPAPPFLPGRAGCPGQSA